MNNPITVENCPHLNQVENFENSFSVCTDCGLEVEQIFSHPPLTAVDRQRLFDESFFKTFKDKQYDFIENCVHRDKLPDSCTYEIYDFYLKLKSKHKQKSNLNEVAAVAIYTWKKENKVVGLNVDDVSTITHIDKKKIYKCEAKKSGKIKYNTPKSIIATAPIEALGLKYKDMLIIKSICSKFKGNDCNPKSIAAALVHIYCSLEGKKITNSKIIEAFNICNMTLYRTKKKIEKKANSILTKKMKKIMNKNSKNDLQNIHIQSIPQ